MLTCKQITEKASQLIDGELSFFEGLGIQLHMFMCKNCRNFIQKFSHLVSRLNEPQSGLAPAEFTERVMQSLPPAKGSAELPEGQNSEVPKPNRRISDKHNRLF